MGRTARLYLGSVAAATVVYYLLPAAAELWWYNAISLSAAAAMLIGALHYRLEPRTAWVLLGLGMLSFAVGDVLFGESQHVPSAADMFYVSAYPLLGLGLAGLAPSWVSIRDRAQVAIAVFITATIGVMAWALLVLPPSDPSGPGVVTKAVALSYPAMDLILIGLLARAAMPERFSDVRARLLGVGLMLQLIADISYAVQDFGNTYGLGGAEDAAWLLSYGFLGAALLFPEPEPYDVDVIETDLDATGPGGVAVKARLSTVERLSRSTDLRFGVVVSAAGRMLLALGVAAMLAGAAWLAIDVVILAGAYVTMGILMWVAAARAA